MADNAALGAIFKGLGRTARLLYDEQERKKERKFRLDQEEGKYQRRLTDEEKRYKRGREASAADYERGRADVATDKETTRKAKQTAATRKFDREHLEIQLELEADSLEKEKKHRRKLETDPNYGYQSWLNGENDVDPESPIGKVYQARFQKDLQVGKPTGKPPDYAGKAVTGYGKYQASQERTRRLNAPSTYYSKDRPEDPVEDPYAHLPKLGSTLDYYNAMIRGSVQADERFADPNAAADSIAQQFGEPAPFPMGGAAMSTRGGAVSPGGQQPIELDPDYIDPQSDDGTILQLLIKEKTEGLTPDESRLLDSLDAQKQLREQQEALQGQ